MTDTEFQEHPPVNLDYLKRLVREQSQDIAELRQRVSQLELVQAIRERHA